MTALLAEPAARLAAMLCAVLSFDLRTPVRVSPSHAIMDARAHAAARRMEAGSASAGCSEDAQESADTVVVPFANYSADLNEPQRSALDPIAARLSCVPNLAVLIVSDGDAHRLEAYRREVAERRAEVIAAYLRAHGAPAVHIARGSAADAGATQAEGVLVITAVGPAP